MMTKTKQSSAAQLMHQGVGDGLKLTYLSAKPASGA
jgi:hypothetical protein